MREINMILTMFILSIMIILLVVTNIARKFKKPITPSLMREYQIELSNDSVYIYDGNRYVGSALWQDGCNIDSVFLKDNL